MKRFNVWSVSLILMLAVSLMISSCKKNFDEPPGPTDPGITPTHTISQLKAMHAASGAYDVINADVIIGGVVVANDKSGNLYKELYIQDGTGGINILLDANGLYNSFPVGRQVYIKCNGLCISDYNRLIQLGVKATVAGSPSLEAIASTLIDQYIIGGTLNNPVTPRVVTLNDLSTNMQDEYLGSLIQLNNYEFVTGDTSKTYADTSAYKNSVNLTVKSCGANSSIIIRSSGYANFAGVNVPNGNGTLTAIYTVYGNTKQLILRDTADVQFNNYRCGQGPTTVMNIADVRALYSGSTTAAPDGKRITGVVISDRSTNNINSQNLVLQQGNGLAGILVRFDSPHSFNLGDSLDVNVSLQEVSEYRGLLQVNLVPLNYATRVSTGKTITPRVATITDINSNFEAWESTLVTINDVALSGSGSSYSGSVNLTDVTGSLVMFTSSSASFAGQIYPANATAVTGYLTQFDATYELGIRNPGAPLNDVVAAAPPPPSGNDLIISEYIEGSSNNKYLEIYNGGSATADLSLYDLKLYSNGNTSVTNSLNLATVQATLAPGEIIVIQNASAALTLPAGVTAFSSGVCNFNGDDAIQLEKSGVVIDVFGEKGVDPGSSWTIAGDATAAVNKGVRRNAGITAGNIDWTTSSASEWTVNATIDDVSNLGTR
ncbi:MAG TPA: DUF5689 domain-containing protein [Chitinophagaceae bacterium]|nr:lamin tail domain-containing protein [Chitinophagaceae bacterium]MCB9056779.1 lamin tail domain-containing protein [Chitinophagales bacterium]HPG11573.1 DUF5689 domain-containing protein [Chitinophagaceae bacterium]HRX92809.1 DUF5689 domain-containing protein [Chitinophagaceae bacterium]